MQKYLFVFLLMIVASSAFAQAPQQQNPCSRGGRTSSIGGVDQQQGDCARLFDAQRMGQDAATINDLNAQLMLLRQDLQAAKTSAQVGQTKDVDRKAYWAKIWTALVERTDKSKVAGSAKLGSGH